MRSALQWRDIVPGAQTERRGGAGPVRGLLGGKGLTGRLFLLFVVRVLLSEHGLLLFCFQFREQLLEILARTQPGQIVRFFSCLTSRKPLATACRKSAMAFSGWFNWACAAAFDTQTWGSVAPSSMAFV